MESPAETTSPGVFVAFAAPSDAEEGLQPLLPRGSLLYGAGVGLLVAIGIGTAYFLSFRDQEVHWTKLAVHLFGYCVASCAALGILLDRALGRDASTWLGSVGWAAASGALAATVPGALAVGHFARLRMEFIGAGPLVVAALGVMGLFALRAVCRHRGTRGFGHAVSVAAGITLGSAGLLALVALVLIGLAEWPSEYEAARMLMIADLRAAQLLDAFYYGVGAMFGAVGGALIGSFVGLWGLGRAAR